MKTKDNKTQCPCGSTNIFEYKAGYFVCHRCGIYFKLKSFEEILEDNKDVLI